MRISTWSPSTWVRAISDSPVLSMAKVFWSPLIPCSSTRVCHDVNTITPILYP
ncbi:hypothetical protein SK128_024286, partial [Halocaridina rubra]